MINEHEKLNHKLSKLFYCKFWANLIILLSVSIGVLIVLIITLCNFLKGTENLKIVVMCLCIFIVLVVATIIGLKPFIRDMTLVKRGRFEIVTGEVIKYRRVVHGGDPDTINYYPTIKDIKKEWIEIEVKADNTELNKTYHCVYLPNTKLAVCEELLILNEVTERKL